MSGDDPLAVTRELNDWFAAVPFDDLKKALIEADSLEAGMARLEEMGHGSTAHRIDPDVELDVTAFPGGGTLPSGQGTGVWLRFWQEWLEPWEGLKIAPGGYEQSGDHVLTSVRVTATGGLSGAEVDLQMWQAWTVRDGRVVRYAVFASREDAVADLERLQAAGSDRP